MTVVLNGRQGKTFTTSDEHWSVFLNVAQRHGWQPTGSLPPPDWPRGECWAGLYATGDGQRVAADDARAFATALYEAVQGDRVVGTLRDVIGNVELAAERSGQRLRSADRMAPRDFYDEFAPLLRLLYDGEFTIG